MPTTKLKFMKITAILGIIYSVGDFVVRRFILSAASPQAAQSAGEIIDIIFGVPISIALIVVAVMAIRIEKTYYVKPENGLAAKRWGWAYLLSIPVAIVILGALVIGVASAGQSESDLMVVFNKIDGVMRFISYILNIGLSIAVITLVSSEISPKFRYVETVPES